MKVKSDFEEKAKRYYNDVVSKNKMVIVGEREHMLIFITGYICGLVSCNKVEEARIARGYMDRVLDNLGLADGTLECLGIGGKNDA